MSYKWITVKGSAGDRSFKVSASGDKHYVYDGSGGSLGTASSQEDAISIIKSKYGKKVWSVDIGPERTDSCFPGSTLILTPSGLRKISTLEPGDVVISFKRGTAMPCISTVTRRLDHADEAIWEIQTASQVTPLRCTAIHSYLTKRGWVQACQLQKDDQLLGLNQCGKFTTTVTEVTETDNVEVVHNLYTTGEHNFIADGFIVHNFTYFRQLRTWWHWVFVDPKWTAKNRGLKAAFNNLPSLTATDIEEQLSSGMGSLIAT